MISIVARAPGRTHQRHWYSEKSGLLRAEAAIRCSRRRVVVRLTRSQSRDGWDARQCWIADQGILKAPDRLRDGHCRSCAVDHLETLDHVSCSVWGVR